MSRDASPSPPLTPTTAQTRGGASSLTGTPDRPLDLTFGKFDRVNGKPATTTWKTGHVTRLPTEKDEKDRTKLRLHPVSEITALRVRPSC